MAMTTINRIDPIDIKKQVSEGKLKFWVKDGMVYCSDNTCTVIVGRQ